MNKFGGLEKVIVFNRGNAVQALVQLADVDTASKSQFGLTINRLSFVVHSQT